jgi:hypothetical protein
MGLIVKNILNYNTTEIKNTLRVRKLPYAIIIVCVIVDACILCGVEASYGSLLSPLVIFISGMTLVGMSAIVSICVVAKSSKFGVKILICIAALCLLPPILLLTKYRIESVNDKARNDLIVKIFRERISDPIPSSVNYLCYGPGSNARCVLYFSASKSDIDSIIERKEYIPVTIEKLLYPIEDFENMDYLKFGQDDELYQIIINGNDIYTIRVKNDHTQMAFRWDKVK